MAFWEQQASIRFEYSVQWFQSIFCEALLYICFYSSTPTVAVYSMKVGGGSGKHYREHRHSVWTTVLFNVSRMLVNLTLLKSTVKHYAKYDITPAQTRFMIFDFIYKDQGRAGHRVQFGAQSPQWRTERHTLLWRVETLTPDLIN